MNKIEETIRTKFNFLKKFYDETWDKSGHTLHIGLFKNKKDTLNKAYKQATEYLVSTASDIKPFDKNSTVLDIGCGTGRTIIEICAKFDCQGTGIDLSDEQIKDAREYLEKLNEQRTKQGKKTINVKFVRGSGSELEKRFRKNEQFSHIISQDAILLVNNKQSLFENVFRILKPGGTLAVADFLSESDNKKISNTEKNLIYKLVNWDKPLSFQTYKNILTTVGLNIIKSEKK
ncbi:class I SAM-dependent methyltransferase, partial [Candidatus Falkowbacteria bacterium]|nr:class I SAM-dependent methyltransferase [Candidatus Falkowbacteria bacterium]